MPVAHDPLKPEFYVYRFEVRGIPFYVGIGRSSRASDRVRYVRYLAAREAAGKPVKWVLSNRVIAAFLNRNEEVRLVYLHEHLTRADSLECEREEIARLCRAGFVLANQQHNALSLLSADEIVQSVLQASRRPTLDA